LPQLPTVASAAGWRYAVRRTDDRYPYLPVGVLPVPRPVQLANSAWHASGLELYHCACTAELDRADATTTTAPRIFRFIMDCSLRLDRGARCHVCQYPFFLRAKHQIDVTRWASTNRTSIPVSSFATILTLLGPAIGFSGLSIAVTSARISRRPKPRPSWSKRTQPAAIMSPHMVGHGAGCGRCRLLIEKPNSWFNIHRFGIATLHL